jgi:hypothetical protein
MAVVVVVVVVVESRRKSYDQNEQDACPTFLSRVVPQ